MIPSKHETMLYTGLALFILLATGIVAADAQAQSALSRVLLSSDIAASIPGTDGGIVHGDDAAVFEIEPRSNSGRLVFESLRARAFGVTAVDVGAFSFPRLSIDSVARIEGKVIRPGDVFDFQGTCTTGAESERGTICGVDVVFDAREAGVPDRVGVDAVSSDPELDVMLLSFDSMFTLDGEVIRPSDVVSYNGDSFTKAFDSHGVVSSGNLDALHRLDNGHWLLSFDIDLALTGSDSMITASDSDLLEYDPDEGTFVSNYRLQDLHASWHAADLKGVWGESLGDLIFADRFEG